MDGGKQILNREMLYCDICPFECCERSDFILHLSSDAHALRKRQNESVIEELYSDAASILIAQDWTWERCFDCGAVDTQTVVCVICSRCRGNGEGVLSSVGLPGTYLPQGLPRFICVEHALRQMCMSCGTPLAASNYFIDPDSRGEEDFRFRLQMDMSCVCWILIYYECIYYRLQS